MTGTKCYGSGSGMQRHYIVEVRSTFTQPTVISKDFVIDAEWRRLPVFQSIGGVRTRNWSCIADDLRLMNLSAAQAIAYMFLANLHADMIVGAMCIQARIVEIELTYSYSTKESGVGSIINCPIAASGQFTARETISGKESA